MPISVNLSPSDWNGRYTRCAASGYAYRVPLSSKRYAKRSQAKRESYAEGFTRL